jgi:hypothetical protein
VPAASLKNTKPAKLDKKKAEKPVPAKLDKKKAAKPVGTKKAGSAIVKKPASQGCENVA